MCIPSAHLSCLRLHLLLALLSALRFCAVDSSAQTNRAIAISVPSVPTLPVPALLFFLFLALSVPTLFAPIRSIPVRFVPVRSIPALSAPVRSVPALSTLVRSIPTLSIPVLSIPCPFLPVPSHGMLLCARYLASIQAADARISTISVRLTEW